MSSSIDINDVLAVDTSAAVSSSPEARQRKAQSSSSSSASSSTVSSGGGGGNADLMSFYGGGGGGGGGAAAAGKAEATPPASRKERRALEKRQMEAMRAAVARMEKERNEARRERDEASEALAAAQEQTKRLAEELDALKRAGGQLSDDSQQDWQGRALAAERRAQSLQSQLDDIERYEMERMQYMDPEGSESVADLERAAAAAPVDAAAAAPASSEDSTGVLEVCFENERFIPLLGFRKPSLPTDRPEFSDASGKVRRPLDSVELPEGWRWATNWRIDLSGDVDAEGWSYSKDFPDLFSWRGTEQRLDAVRRRRWVRLRERVPVLQAPGSATPQW